MDYQLDKLSLKELQGLQKSVMSAIASYEARMMSEARSELEAKAREFGFTLSDFVGGNMGKKLRAPAAVKYRGPNCEEWSGRGRKPTWFHNAMIAGHSPEEFLVADEGGSGQ